MVNVKTIVPKKKMDSIMKMNEMSLILGLCVIAATAVRSIIPGEPLCFGLRSFLCSREGSNVIFIGSC